MTEMLSYDFMQRYLPLKNYAGGIILGSKIVLVESGLC